MKNIAVFVSGGGTNLQALIDAQERGEIKDGKITLVLSSSENAYALQRAKNAGIERVVVSRKAYSSKEDYDKAILGALRGKEIDLIVNTSEGKQSAKDGYIIRRLAIELGIPYVTTLAGARAALNAIAAVQDNELNVKSLNEYADGE